MLPRVAHMKAAAFAVTALLTATSAFAAEPADFWLDLVSGDEAAPADVMADLAKADVVYVGEAHTIDRHHAIQLGVLQELAARGVPLALCMEQLEARDQAIIDRYNSGELNFDQLAQQMDWAKKWKNFADYRALCEFAHAHGIPLRALNAPAEIIRAVSRGGGLAKLPAEQRAALPADIQLDDPVYERRLNQQLAVHMALDPAKLRPVFEAQVARDETMAANIAAARTLKDADGRPRVPVVIVGDGHIRYGLGTPARVLRRLPGATDRIILATESGQLKLSDSDKAAMRDVSISHADLRAIGRPPGDYLRVLPLAAAPGK
jgi:uncharacterized iron-regulated protein